MKHERARPRRLSADPSTQPHFQRRHHITLPLLKTSPRALSRARKENVYEKAIMLYQIQWHLKYSNDVVTALSVCVRLNLGEVPFS